MFVVDVVWFEQKRMREESEEKDNQIIGMNSEIQKRNWQLFVWAIKRSESRSRLVSGNFPFIFEKSFSKSFCGNAVII